MGLPSFMTDESTERIREELSREFGVEVVLTLTEDKFVITIPKGDYDVNSKLKSVVARFNQLLSVERSAAFFNTSCYVYVLFTDGVGHKGAFRCVEHQLLSDAVLKEKGKELFYANIERTLAMFRFSLKAMTAKKTLRNVTVNDVQVARSVEQADAYENEHHKLGYI